MAVSYPHSLPLLHQQHTRFNHEFKFKIISCSSSNNKIHVNTTKKKPKPSFFEQIKDKWSVKLTSTTQKLPWQQQQEEEQQRDMGLQEYEEEIVSTPQKLVSNSDSSKAPSSGFVQSRAINAPWVNGLKYSKSQFYLVRKEEEFGVLDDNKDISFEKEVDDRNGIDEEMVKLGSVEIGGEFDEKPIVGNGVASNSGSIELPWEEGEVSDSMEGGRRKRRSNTELAEELVPQHELKRLRNVSLRMLERIKVGAAGITQELVDIIHQKWKLDEVVKLKFEEPYSRNMKRTHEILESRTGGLVIWRSGSSVVLFRGMSYNLHCVQLYSKHSEADLSHSAHKEDLFDNARNNVGINDFSRDKETFVPVAARYLKDLSLEELMDFHELNHLLDELGPRFKDWCGREPLPVDADLLPPVVPGYQTPYRLLPYGTRRRLTDKETTDFRRIARTMPPHFALGRNRELQGLAKAMIKLWENSAIAKIAIKRGVQTTRNERMAEELKRLTGGTLLSRNKEYIVFYRGNDFLPPAVTKTLKEKNKLTYLQQDEEELARRRASAFVESKAKVTKTGFIAGTLTETLAATARWQVKVDGEDVEKMRRDEALSRHALLVKHLENKLAMAKGKLKRAEKALAKVQEFLEPTDLPTDLETLSDEERFLYRKIGLSMKPYLPLGRREVYDGTILNMHLHWKFREVVKIIVRGKSFAQVKHIAISLEAESGGVLVSVDKTTKGYAIILHRGKNYERPREMKPSNLLTKRQALARSIELQRREALKHHILDLQERIELIKSELEEKEKFPYSTSSNDFISDDDDAVEDGGEEAYLEVYDTDGEGSVSKN